MKNKKMKWVVFVFLLTMMVPTYFVWANDDDDEYEGEHGYEEHDREGDDYRYHEEDDEHGDEYHYEEILQPSPVETVPSATWDVWSRTLDTEKGELPFDISETVKIENQDGKQMDAYVIPNEGEVMIPAVKTADLIGATVKYYKTVEIAEMQLDTNELIVKSSSNAAYENEMKTPMPAEAMMYQDELYIPISVLTNGLGLTATWDEAKQTFVIQQ